MKTKRVYGRPERKLSLPDAARHAIIHSWLNDMLTDRAPRDFVQATACLLDEQIAEKVYEAVFRCTRGEPLWCLKAQPPPTRARRIRPNLRDRYEQIFFLTGITR